MAYKAQKSLLHTNSIILDMSQMNPNSLHSSLTGLLTWGPFYLHSLSADTFSFFFSLQLTQHFSECVPKLPINQLPPLNQLSWPNIFFLEYFYWCDYWIFICCTKQTLCCSIFNSKRLAQYVLNEWPNKQILPNYFLICQIVINNILAKYTDNFLCTPTLIYICLYVI